MMRGGTFPPLVDILQMRENKEDSYRIFCDHVLSQVVGKNDWKTRAGKETISSIATVSDEAFSILLLENNYQVWKEDALGACGEGQGVKASSKYTVNGAGTRKYQGWTPEGLKRFNTLAAMVHADRISNNGTFEKMIKDNKLAAENRRKGKKKVDAMTEESANSQIQCYIEGGDMVAI
jgi:hypothetical protein